MAIEPIDTDASVLAAQAGDLACERYVLSRGKLQVDSCAIWIRWPLPARWRWSPIPASRAPRACGPGMGHHAVSGGDLATIEAIAHLCSPFSSKFGVPRQSGLVADLRATVVFCPKYRSREAVRGLEGFSHIWLIWRFHQAVRGQNWSPTVRPPRLGGNQRVGVFATRSPPRPNALGLSAVRLEGIAYTRSWARCSMWRGRI